MSGWQTILLGDVTTKVGSGSTPRGGESAYKPSGIPLIRSMNVHFDGFRKDGLAYLDEEQAAALRNVEVQAGDVLLNITGASIGRVTVAPASMHGARVNQHVCIIRPDSRLDSSFLRWHLASPPQQRLINSVESGATRQALTKEKILGFEVPLPPLAQQRETIAEIEKQFSRLDEAVAGLKRVKANLKRYKAAVLKAAVEGRLVPTEADLARREGRSYETGAQLLQRILETRRSQWQGKGKYKEPVAPDMTDLPELPQGWAWASLDALSWDSAYGTSEKCSYENSGPAVLRIPNVQNAVIDLGDLKFASPTFSLPAREAVTVGDMLIIRTNGSKSLIGRAAVVLFSPSKVASYASYLIRFRLMPMACLPHWVSVVWQTPQIRSWIEAHAATSAGQHNVSMTTLATAAVPIPPTAEQHRIVAEVDRRLSIVREVEAQVDANLKRAQALRQSVLSKAFSA